MQDEIDLEKQRKYKIYDEMLEKYRETLRVLRKGTKFVYHQIFLFVYCYKNITFLKYGYSLRLSPQRYGYSLSYLRNLCSLYQFINIEHRPSPEIRTESFLCAKCLGTLSIH